MQSQSDRTAAKALVANYNVDKVENENLKTK